METSLIHFLRNIAKTSGNIVTEYEKSVISINRLGDSLEHYIKRLFVSNLDNFKEDIKKEEQIFSYLGNQNNPPDMIIKNSDAIEVKKIEGKFNDIALNSSYPKAKLYSNDPMITAYCRKCEGEKKWEKDLIYMIGSLHKNKDTKIKYLFCVYGSLYAADKDHYERIKNSIKKEVNLFDLEMAETKELGRVNEVDPLGITSLRIRGMWTIKNPFKVFDYIDSIKYEEKIDYSVFSLIPKEKFNTFNKDVIKELLSMKEKVFFQNVEVKNPNNPAELIDAININIFLKGIE